MLMNNPLRGISPQWIMYMLVLKIAANGTPDGNTILNNQQIPATEIPIARQRRSIDGDFTCPDVDANETACPHGCNRMRLLCTAYASLFQALPNSRTSGAVTVAGVSRETCAARCGLLAPDCLHFSYNPVRGGQCILGCRAGSTKCQSSEGLVSQNSWTLFFVSARKLASAGREFLTQLGRKAGIDSGSINSITDALGSPGRFGGRDVEHAGTEAIRQLLATSEEKKGGSTEAVDSSVASMIANGRDSMLPADCGRVPLQGLLALIPFVAHGRPAAPGQYPWQARILVVSGGSLKHRCGGIIITDRHILTAAHCLRNVAINQIEVSVGEVNLDEPNEYRERFALQNMFFHENYTKGGQHNNDIMLLRLRLNRRASGDVGAIFSDFVQPACVPSSGLHYDVDPPLVCEVSGWGSTSSESRVTTNDLRAVDVPMVSDQYCGSPEAYGTQFVRDYMFCAGYTDPGKGDSCGGDSGGPLACPLHESGRYAVYGIVSHGHWKGCGQEPGVYTRVEHYTGWILDVVRLLG